MKCCECCKKIPKDEEIQCGKKYFCETCQKSNNRARTFDTYTKRILAWFLLLLLFAFTTKTVYDWLKSSKKKED